MLGVCFVFFRRKWLGRCLRLLLALWFVLWLGRCSSCVPDFSFSFLKVSGLLLLLLLSY